MREQETGTAIADSGEGMVACGESVSQSAIFHILELKLGGRPFLGVSNMGCGCMILNMLGFAFGTAIALRKVFVRTLFYRSELFGRLGTGV